MNRPLITALFVLICMSAFAQYWREADSLRKVLEKSKPDTNRISLQLRLASYYLSKPGDFRTVLDSSITFINQSAELSTKLHEIEWQYKATLLAGTYYGKTGDFERSRENFMLAIAHYHQKNNIIKQADAWNTFGEIWYDYNANDAKGKEAISFFRRARLLYLQVHELKKAAKALNNIGGIHTDFKEFDLADKELHQVLIEYKASGYKKRQDAYEWLYNLEQSKGNYYRAMTYALEGIKSMKTSGDTGLTSFFISVWPIVIIP
jgi:hypothetical protein